MTEESTHQEAIAILKQSSKIHEAKPENQINPKIDRISLLMTDRTTR